MLKYIETWIHQLVRKKLGIIFKYNLSEFRIRNLPTPFYPEVSSNINTQSIKFVSLLIKPLIFGMVLFLSIGNGYALKAETAKTIIGHKPYLLLSDGETKITDLKEMLGFKMPKQDNSEGTELIDVSMENTTLKIPTGMKYSDVLTVVTADGISHTLEGITVGDIDGDADIVANTSVIGEIKATWYDEGVAVPASDLKQQISDCNGPYTLKIEIPLAISANTKYGDPSINEYGTHDGVTYTFMPAKPRLCFIQPHSMQVNTKGIAGSSIKFADGYNSATWVAAKTSSLTHKGFKVATGFPTTGFKGAQFSLIGSGIDQSSYRCKTSDHSGKITLSSDNPTDNEGTTYPKVGENCTVTYNSETKAEFTSGGTPTITMEYNTGSDWVVIGSYQIPSPTKWAIYKGQMVYGTWHNSNLENSTDFPALDACQNLPEGSTTARYGAGHDAEARLFRQKYLYRRDELSNSPYANKDLYPEDSAPTWVSNYSSRDVDGTFNGEWGNLIKYSGSGWSFDEHYWTAETWSTVNLFYVHSTGDVAYASPNIDYFVTMCRGD